MRKRACVLFGAVAWLLMLTEQSWARIEPQFSLETCAWNATEIVVVSQQGKSVTVLETWQGSLAPGAVIEGLDLPAPPLEVWAWTIAPRDRETLEEERPVKTVFELVSGKRLVLFLKHAEAKAGAAPVAEWAGTEWTGAGWTGAQKHGEMMFSAAWIQRGDVYAFLQDSDEGPSHLVSLGAWGRHEDGFKQATLKIVAAKDALTKAVQTADVAQRVALLEPMTRSKRWYERHEATAALGECGPAAVPILQKLLHEYGKYTAEVTAALAHAAGDNAGAEMTAALEQELAFWKKVGPELPVGWWNTATENQHQYRNHYGVLQAALTTVRETRYAPGPTSCASCVICGFRCRNWAISGALSASPPIATAYWRH